MKLPSFYDSLTSLNGAQHLQPREVTRDLDAESNGSRWRPFWQRGHSNLEDVNEVLRVQTKNAPVSKHNRKTSSRKNKLYHSTLDLSNAGIVKKRVKMSKSVSLQGLNRAHYNETGKRDSKHGSKGSTSHRNSGLNLPRIEPDVEFSTESKSRGSSATTAMKSSASRERTHSLYNDSETEAEEEEEDVYVSDEDPEISRQNLDKAGDYIVEHDWILKEKLAKEAREVNALHKKVQIILPDEDPLDTINSRMEEITMMVKPKAEYGNFIESIDPEQKDKIMKYKGLDHREIRKRKRKNWTPTKRFQDAVHQVLMIIRACHPRRRYLLDDKPDTAPDSVKKIKETSTPEKDVVVKSSLALEMQMSLIAQPHFRNQEDIKRVIWMLRATKAFKNLFPAQLEDQLAKVVTYERYDDKRIVAQQGRDPENFYHVLTGKLLKVREYRLLSGVVNREEGFIEKGNTSDPEEMSNSWPREHHLVTKGNVEVFVINKQDFIDLLHTCKGPPVDFLQRLDLFKEFPCNEFIQSPEAIDFRYFGQDQIVVQDTNRTPWLHVVKTGHVKVVRQQTVIDVQGEDKFSGQATEELGCVRPFSHAGAMLGLLANQRKMKTIVGAISFPEITTRPGLERSNTDQFDLASKLKRIRREEKTFDNPITRRTNRTSLASVQTSEANSPSPRALQTRRKSKTLTQQPLPDSARRSSMADVNAKPLSDIHEGSEGSAKSVTRFADLPKQATNSPRSPAISNGDVSSRKNSTSRQSGFLPPIASSSQKGEKADGEFVPHGTYLTRERTEFDQVYNQKQKKEVIQRKTYLQLDILKPGDIFNPVLLHISQIGLNDIAAQFRSMYPLHDKFGGLEHMEPQALASEAPGVTLISDGAEIIRISKRFFLQHAQNNTMLKVETMQREYMEPDEAKTKMYDKETWRQYKTVLLQRTVDNLHRNQIEKVK